MTWSKNHPMESIVRKSWKKGKEGMGLGGSLSLTHTAARNGGPPKEGISPSKHRITDTQTLSGRTGLSARQIKSFRAENKHCQINIPKKSCNGTMAPSILRGYPSTLGNQKWTALMKENMAEKGTWEGKQCS